MKILLTVKFWDDGQKDSTRIRNISYTWPQLKKLTAFLKDGGIDCDCKLYDFSPAKILPEADHIPYNAGEYKKAEKTNRILDLNPEYDYLFMFDCDTFFLEEDYPKVLEVLALLSERELYTFDLLKLTDGPYLVGLFEKDLLNLNEVDCNYAYSGPKLLGPLAHGNMGGIGGVYLCAMILLTENNGFDEKYVGWGGEDGDMLGRIMYSGNPYRLTPVRSFAPIHLPHYVDWGSKAYSQRFLENS